MTKIAFFIICIMSLFSLKLKSQEGFKQQKESAEIPSLAETKRTIQVVFLSSEKDNPVALTGDLIDKIENLRDENKITYLEINQGCRIKILPKNITSQKDFKPMEEYIIVNKFEN